MEMKKYCLLIKGIYSLLILLVDSNKVENHHPTILIKKATLTLVRSLSVSAGIHSEVSQKEAVGTLCGLMRNIVDCGCNYGLSEYFSVFSVIECGDPLRSPRKRLWGRCVD